MTNAIRKYTHVSLKKHEPNTETSSNILSGFIRLSLKSIASHLFTRPIVSDSCRARGGALILELSAKDRIPIVDSDPGILIRQAKQICAR